MYHYVYKLEHVETNEFYFGSRTSKLHPSLDSYMGSMCTWKPDKTKLRKIIIKDDFNSREEAILFESILISENIENELNRNYFIPNKGFHTVGMKRSEEWKKQNSKRLSGVGNPMFNKNLFDIIDRLHFSKLVSNGLQKYYSNGGSGSFKGKTHTIETKKLMSDKAKLRTPEQNSQFGTCWIHNIDLNENKKIKKEVLESYLKLGWIKGRKTKL